MYKAANQNIEAITVLAAVFFFRLFCRHLLQRKLKPQLRNSWALHLVAINNNNNFVKRSLSTITKDNKLFTF